MFTKATEFGRAPCLVCHRWRACKASVYLLFTLAFISCFFRLFAIVYRYVFDPPPHGFICTKSGSLCVIYCFALGQCILYVPVRHESTVLYNRDSSLLQLGLPIRANYSRERHGFCLVVSDETKNETFDLLQMNQSETVKQGGHP